jgi:hypothetical protein
MNRRTMIVTLAALAALPAMPAGLAACGGDDAGTPPPPPGPSDGGGSACTRVSPTIADNHGHTLTVPLADVTAGTERTYDIRGSSGHAHAVTLTAGNFATLRSGGVVNVRSTSGGGHIHDVTVRCA